jgi:hypothetical protein
MRRGSSRTKAALKAPGRHLARRGDVGLARGAAGAEPGPAGARTRSRWPLTGWPQSARTSATTGSVNALFAGSESASVRRPPGPPFTQRRSRQPTTNAPERRATGARRWCGVRSPAARRLGRLLTGGT